MSLRDEQRTPDVIEPIMEKKDCKLRIDGAEVYDWTPKEQTNITEKTKAMKLQMTIIDEDAVCENTDAKPRVRIDDYLNLAPHPYVSGKTGEVEKLRPNKVYQLCKALGFELEYVDDQGGRVDPGVNAKTGRTYCPKGCHERLNPEFVDAYFDDQDEPRFDAWIGREIVAHVGVDAGTAEFGPSNKVRSYKPKQQD